MEQHSPSVNLLKTKGNSFADRFISWALTIGRMVIILTETIALTAFLYRFILDRQIIDQKDQIAQKAAQIKLFDKNEKEYRNLQDRLQLISQLQNQASKETILIKDVLGAASSGILFNTVSVSSESIHVDTNVQSVAALTSFVNKLKQNPQIASVSIDKIENKTLSATIVVGITAKLQKETNQPTTQNP